MGNNIFENAYFGKAYKTRDGRKAIYHMGHDKNFHELILSDGILLCNDDGSSRIKEENRDIVSEWQEPIDEEELDELAMIKYPCNCSLDETYCDCCINPDLKEAFKAGCRKMLIK